jgi:hypothetical protein
VLRLHNSFFNHPHSIIHSFILSFFSFLLPSFLHDALLVGLLWSAHVVQGPCRRFEVLHEVLQGRRRRVVHSLYVVQLTLDPDERVGQLIGLVLRVDHGFCTVIEAENRALH